MSGQPTTHTTLIARLSQGADPLAWHEFCDRYGKLILGFAHRHGLQPADCDDVLQDVLKSLTQSMPGFQYDPAKGRFRSYLKTVVMHAISRRACQNRPEMPLDNNGPCADPAGSVAEQMWEAEWRQYHLRQAMRTIAEDFGATTRAAFERYVLAGEDAHQTAESLGLSVDQVYQAKSRILRRLCRIIRDQVQEEG